MINAKTEFLEVIKTSNSTVKCAQIVFNCPLAKVITLSVDYIQEEYNALLNALDFEYDEYESSLSGYIWFENGNFLKRSELGDGSECWELMVVPKIPDNLTKPNFWNRLFNWVEKSTRPNI